MYLKIIKFKKISSSKYKIFFDSGENITLHEDIIIKHNLIATKCLDDNYEEVINDNNNYIIYDMVLKYISNKMKCESEIRNYLNNKNIDEKLCNEIIYKLKSNGLLDDRKYIKSYISDKVHLNNFGLNKIRNELINLKLDKEIIEEEISIYPREEIMNNLNKMINKKIRTNRTYGGNILKQKIISEFVNKGYNKEDILEVLNSINLNSDELYDKEYNKLYNKYKNKYSDSELNYYIKQKLYSKGLKKSD